MHRDPRTDDTYDVMTGLLRVVHVLDPPPDHLVESTQLTLARSARSELVWSFYVGVSTHDLLRQGITVHHYTKVTVAASTFAEAQDIAACMAACGGWMPTETVRIED